jgi:pyruvate dehydrogenase (quinone)
MTQTVGDYVLQRLREWDVGEVFAYPGDGINGILGAFGRAEAFRLMVQGAKTKLQEAVPGRSR